MTKYQELLEVVGIISEEMFNEIMDSLPEYDYDFTGISSDDLIDCDYLCDSLINQFLGEYPSVYAQYTDYNTKSLDLEEIDSLEVLEKLKSLLGEWTISNYDEIKQELEEELKEKKSEKEFNKLIDVIKSKATIVQLQKFVENL